MKPPYSSHTRTPINVHTIIAATREPRFSARFQVGLVVALAVALFLSFVLFSGLLTPLDPVLTDIMYHPFTPSGQVVIIAIDKKSLDALGTFPWPRAVHAELLERLASASPRVIAFDLPFSQSAPEDPGLIVALRKSGNVLLTTIGVEAALYPPQPNALPQYDVLLLPPTDLRDAAAGVGHRMLSADADGILRRVSAAIGSTDTRYPALGIIAAQKYLGASNIEYDLAHQQIILGQQHIQVDEHGRMLLNFTGMREGIPTFSYVDVFKDQVPASNFAGKIVLIGGVSNSEAETFATPLTSGNNTVYNVVVQAALADMLISTPTHVLSQQDALDQIAIILMVALVAGLTLPHIRPTYAAVLTIVFLLVLLFFAFDSFNHGLIVRILFPALAIILTFLCIAVFRYLSEERRRQFLTTLFRRYVPAESVGKIVDAIDRGELPLSGARRVVTVLYADLRGFAALSEGLTPEAVLELVNRYLELMLREIHAESGTVNKPMGDALVAIWNAPLDQPNHALRAVQTALNIRRSLLRFQKNNSEEHTINVSLGLATGWAILGNISALGKVEYTLVGETVNVAARISAFAGNNQILADATTAQALPREIEKRELSPVRVRGRKEPLPVWEIRDTEEISKEETEE